jgi:hypothetical protein
VIGALDGGLCGDRPIDVQSRSRIRSAADA